MTTVPEKQRLSEGAAAHHGLSEAQLLDMHYKMVLARRLQDRCYILQRQGRAAFVISGQGHEAAQVGTAAALRAGVDWVFPYYRSHAACLTLGVTPREMFLNLFAKRADPASGGIQMPSHWSYKRLKIVSGSSPVATQTLHAVGVALAIKRRGEDAIAITYLGEGSTSQGDFHEALNFASIHKLPVIFVVENNGYAISEPTWKEMAIENVSDRAAAYGMKGATVDGNDLLAVYQTAHWAIDEARRGHGPTLLEAKTYRIVPHSSDDDDRRYRTRKEVEEWAKRDPVDRYERYLLEQKILTREEAEKVRQRIDEEIAEAVAWAEQQPDPEPGDMFKHQYAES